MANLKNIRVGTFLDHADFAFCVRADHSTLGPIVLPHKTLADAIAHAEKLEAQPALAKFDDNDEQLFPGATNLADGTPAELAYVELQTSRRPGATVQSCSVVLSGPVEDFACAVHVYDEDPDLVADFGFSNVEDARIFAGMILEGAITIDALRCMKRAI